MNGPSVNGVLPVSPHAGLRADILAQAARLEAAGQAGAAQGLRDAIEGWWRAQQGWNGEVARQLGVHHDINNALVGVRGNAQLLLMGDAARVPGVKDRLEVVLRESDRIRDAAQRLNALKSALTSVVHEDESASPSRAA